jgi:hypothetical protein
MSGNKRYWIYKNLTKRVWSSKLNSNGKVCHIDYAMLLKHVEFRVRPGSLKNLRKTKKKTPCAFIIAKSMTPIMNENLFHQVFGSIRNEIIQVNFFPFKEKTFTIIKNEIVYPVFSANQALLTKDLEVYIDDDDIKWPPKRH